MPQYSNFTPFVVMWESRGIIYSWIYQKPTNFSKSKVGRHCVSILIIVICRKNKYVK